MGTNMEHSESFEREPKDHELAWICVGFVFLTVFLALSFWFGGGAAGCWVALAAVIMLIVTMLTPRELPVGLSRLGAVLILAVLVVLETISGLPLLIANALTPLAQAMQDNGGNLGASANLVWLVLMALLFVVAAVWAVISYASSSPKRIMLSAAVLAVACVPIAGLIAQEMTRVIPT